MSRTSTVTSSPSTQYGVGLRFRGMLVPQSFFEQFVEIAPSGIAQPSFGIELIQRKGTFEAVLGMAWARLNAEDGIWLDEFTRNPHLVEFEDFGWIALDVTTVWKQPISPTVALRYGMGIGVGIVLGDVLETDYECQGNRYDIASCSISPTAKDVREPINLPSVLPVINLLGGLQYAPSTRLAFNLDGGLHTALFVGVSVAYFFP